MVTKAEPNSPQHALEALIAPSLQGFTTIPDQREGVQAIVDLAQKASKIEIISVPTAGIGEGLPETVPLLVDHRGGGGVSNLKTQIEAYRTGPERRSGAAKVTTLQSFIDLTNRHKDAHSAIFGATAWPKPSLTAVIDYHEKSGAPRWSKHRISYDFPITEEFSVWVNQNGKPMEQGEFARFLEDHAAELSAPYDGEKSDYERLFKDRMATPIELITLSRDLEIHVGGKVKRQERLSSGERVVEFVEEHTDRNGEKVEIPGIFMIAVPAFIDGEPVRIPARLRYRVSGGEISWSYQLYRWQFWLRAQVKDDLDKAAKDTALPAFEGSPEAA